MQHGIPSINTILSFNLSPQPESLIRTQWLRPKVHFPSFMLNICGELYGPTEGAVVVTSHPMTGMKDQTTVKCARLLTKSSFYALTFGAGSERRRE